MVKLIWEKGTGYKKYKVKIYENGNLINTVQFGDKRYEHYKDTSPLKLYSHLNHLDVKRRNSYRKRAAGIVNSNYEPTYKIKYTPNWFAYNYLW